MDNLNLIEAAQAIPAMPIQTHVLAVSTAIGAWGMGVQTPKWLQQLFNQKWFQFLSLAILVYQGGGGENIVYSLLIAGIVYGIMYATRDMEIKSLK